MGGRHRKNYSARGMTKNFFWGIGYDKLFNIYTKHLGNRHLSYYFWSSSEISNITAGAFIPLMVRYSITIKISLGLSPVLWLYSYLGG